MIKHLLAPAMVSNRHRRQYDCAIFTDAGLGGEWNDRLGIGNPVSHPSIKQYLKSVKEEQAKARSRPKKA